MSVSLGLPEHPRRHGIGDTSLRGMAEALEIVEAPLR
jgi:hypothetical protein